MTFDPTKPARTKTKPYACRYSYEGSQWALWIHAYDLEDAENRCNQLGIQLDGEVIAEAPVRFGFAVKAICFIRNIFK